MSDTSNIKSLKQSSVLLSRVISRLPFTLIMVILLLLVAWWTNSILQELTANG